MEALLLVIAVLALLAGAIWIRNGRGLRRGGELFGPGPAKILGQLGSLVGKQGGTRSIKAMECEIYSLMGPANNGPRVLQRTLASLRRQYPDRSEEWYYEKALYDLQRDRGL